jgi:dolichol-phosphate mannosyltransferase
LDFASGDAAVIIPCDLQDHPREISRFLVKWREGYHVVWGVRSSRQDDAQDVLFSKLYARIVRLIAMPDYPLTGTGSFCLIDRKVMDALRCFPEHNRVTFCLILSMGFRQIQIPFDRGARRSGKSKYTLGRKLKLFMDVAVSFSSAPIRLATVTGIIFALLGIIYAVYLALSHLFGGVPVPGYTSLMVVIMFFGGIQLIVLGILGEYLWRALDDVRRRPLYLVWQTVGLLPRPGDVAGENRTNL